MRTDTAPRPTRAWYFGTALILAVTWPIGLALFVVWTVIAALSIFTFIAPLLLPLSVAIRWYADVHRRYAGRVLRIAVTRRHTGQHQPINLFGRFTAPLRDPMTWREWVWLLLNSTVGFALSLLQVVILAAAALYLCYPLLYAVTPHEVFGNVFGLYELTSVADAWLVTPLGLLLAALWYVIAPVLSAVNATMMATVIGNRSAQEEDL